MRSAANSPAIYMQRGLSPSLAEQVAHELTAHDALAAHARDELGISDETRARPTQAALASATSFALGAFPPLLATLLASSERRVPAVAAVALGLLLCLGLLAARLGGAHPLRGALRVTFWGALAMTATAAVGQMFGTIAG